MLASQFSTPKRTTTTQLRSKFLRETETFLACKLERKEPRRTTSARRGEQASDWRLAIGRRSLGPPGDR